MVRVLGARIHDDRLRRLGGGVVKAGILNAVVEGAEYMAEYIKESIKHGAVSGPDHVASRPGEPPNADTHQLDESIHVVVDPVNLVARVREDAAYGQDLEFGTSTMEERPHMRPGAKATRPFARKLVVAAVRKANRGV